MARRLRELEPVPVGMITAAIGATNISSWLSSRICRQLPDTAPLMEEHAGLIHQHRAAVQKLRGSIANYQQAFAAAVGRGERPPNEGPSLYDGYLFAPAGCYNALVAPLTRYPVAGWVWYQGEANTRRAAVYSARLKALIADYRTRWQQPTAPFVVVQLPGYEPSAAEEAGSNSPHTSWAWLREQQRQAVLDTPATGLVVTLDAGDARRIHPRDKRPVGRRCADEAWALRNGSVRGQAWLPTEATAVSTGVTAVHFQRQCAAGRLVPAADFSCTVIDRSGATVEATCAAVGDDHLLLRHPTCVAPVEIRYAFSNHPQPTLHDQTGVPVSPFRLEISYRTA
jgi:sialate O-acetylesterase